MALGVDGISTHQTLWKGSVMAVIGEAMVQALSMAFAMFWEIFWALALGFLISGIVQAVVSKKEMVRLLRFAHQQVHMFRHHQVAGHKETVLAADLFQRSLNHLASHARSQLHLPAIATEGYEM